MQAFDVYFYSSQSAESYAPRIFVPPPGWMSFKSVALVPGRTVEISSGYDGNTISALFTLESPVSAVDPVKLAVSGDLLDIKRANARVPEVVWDTPASGMIAFGAMLFYLELRSKAFKLLRRNQRGKENEA